MTDISRRDLLSGAAVAGAALAASGAFVPSTIASTLAAFAAPNSADEIPAMSAVELVGRIRRKELSAREVPQCPAMSVPAGFSARGLPVGLQVVGKPRGDWALLQLAHAFEQATKHGSRRPAI